MEMARGFEELDVWKTAMTLAVLVHRQVLPRLPDHERYVRERQLRRSIQSVPANIAEAYGRHHRQDASWFCYVARGSLEESLSHLSLADKLQYLPDEIFAECEVVGGKTLALLNGYIRYLRQAYARTRSEDRGVPDP
jgi:four helix bundle protein